jgi:lysozyme family protein
MYKLILLLLLSFASIGADFERYFPHLIRLEGILFTVTQYDLGGATKYGVTLKRYKEYCLARRIQVVLCDKNFDNKVDERDLQLTVLQDFKPVYRECYWDAVRASSINNQAIAELFVDLIVNSGVGKDNRHIKALQRIVGVTPDGIIGGNTIRAINKSPPKVTYRRLYKYRQDFYYKIGVGTQKKFLKGWLNRIFKLLTQHQNEKFI